MCGALVSLIKEKKIPFRGEGGKKGSPGDLNAIEETSVAEMTYIYMDVRIMILLLGT